MNLIEKSLTIALQAHAGQVDKANQPYILHLIRVMTRMSNEVEMSAALLHDIVEDTSLTFDQLLEKGIPEEVIEILRHLTKSQTETYDEFIERVMKNKVAVKIKIEDIKDNMNINRLPNLSEADLNRIKKYHRGLKKLMHAK
jgi:(p)ppGpp synthase/HD superfamily hydrolase